MNMDKKKIVYGILIVLFIIVFMALAMLYGAFYSAPSQFLVRYETLDSVFIPQQMDDVTILFFSDLDYGTFMDEKRLSKLTDKINEVAPDAIIFGGDLFDEAYGTIRQNDRDIVVQHLSSLQAPLGKFAVLGDNDYRTGEYASDVMSILFDSNFEVLVNASVLLRNKGSGSVTLTGIDSALNGNPEIDIAYANVGRAVYNIAICHTPDIADEIPGDLTNYMISGHSHGGQAYWGFNALYTPPWAEKYFRGKTTIGNFTLDITNGVGTTIRDVRFLANAEVVLYRLKHKAMME